MKRVTIFAKGNGDLRDSLIAQRVAGGVAWNGINEVLRARHVPATLRVRHETWSRSDALLAAGGNVPGELVSRPLPHEAYTPAMQFSRALFDTPADAYVLSTQPDLYNVLFRHRTEDYLLFARDVSSWPDVDKAWLRASFTPCKLLDPAASMANLARIVRRLRESTDAPVLVYNMSSVMPGDRVHCHEGLGETFATRVQRFNLALVELSRANGISIIDVDNIVARMGADHAKLDQVHFTAAGCRAVAEEVVRVLVDLDVLPAEGTAA